MAEADLKLEALVLKYDELRVKNIAQHFLSENSTNVNDRSLCMYKLA